MVFPAQNITVQDPGIPLAPAIPSIPLMTGIAYGGSTLVNTVAQIGSPAQVRALIGYGPLAEDVAEALSVSGGPINFCIHSSSQSVTLTAAAMTHTGTGVVFATLSGQPNDRYAVLVTIVAGGTRGTATFQFSLDAYNAAYAPFTQSNIYPTAATFAIPNSGLTINFPTGTYVAGDTFALATVPQEPGTTDLATVGALLEASPALSFDLWAVSGSQPSNTTGSAFAAALNGYAVALTNTFRFVRALCDVGSDDTAANINTQASAWTAVRVCPSFGYTIRTSALPFEGMTNRKISCSTSMAVRAIASLISTDLSWTGAGPDTSVREIFFDSNYNQQIDADQISTMRTWPGIPGYFICGAKLKCAFGSDFTDLQFGRVMDVACLTTYKAQFPYQSASFRATSTGTIDPRDAASLDQVVQSSLNDNLLAPLNAQGTPGHVSAILYTVSLTQNIVTTGTLVSTVAIAPLGYAKIINTTLSFQLNA